MSAPAAATHRDPPKVPNHELIKVIGRGSYGEIWLARSVTGVLRAVKIVDRATFDSEKAFEREFEGMARFEPISREHTCFIDILHVGREQDGGFFYYVMELADDHLTGAAIEPQGYESKTLKSEMSRRGRLPAEECIALGISLAEGLAALHSEKLVHRDIKPANIIFVGGRPKIADIGLVAASGQNSFVGTEGYVPPEGPGSAQADIYSLGKLLYEMAMGKDRLDFPQLNTDLAELPDKRALLRLNEVLLRACASDPGQRYASAEAMREDLVRIQAGKPLAARSRRRRMLAMAALLLVALAVAGVWWAQQRTARGAVVVSSEPPGAMVLIEEKMIRAPARFERLREGAHAMTVMLSGYDKVTRTIEVFGDQERTLPIVRLERSTGGLKLTGKPPGATFELRQGEETIESRGFPAELKDLPTGAYEVAARYDEEEKRMPVEVTRGAVTALEIEFRFGALNVTSEPAGAVLSVDGRAKGTTPVELELIEGEHAIAVSHRNWPVQSRIVTVDPAAPAAERFDFPFGRVKISSRPAGAAIFHRGMEIGTTPDTINDVEPGEQTYELQLAGYRPFPKTVTVQPGKLEFVGADLSKRLGPERGEPWENSLGMKFAPVGDILMSVWETRVRDCAAFCTATERTMPAPDFDQTPEDPVVMVNREDATEFCQWLTAKELGEDRLAEGQSYRLPTDLEWSEAAGLPEEGGSSPQARDGNIREFFWGSEWPPPAEAGNFADYPLRRGKPSIPGSRDGYKQTAPVGSFAPNALGLFDMAGNVREWCLEPYRPDSQWGVVRGGSWDDARKDYLYVSCRHAVDPTERQVHYGFRVVLVPEGRR